MSKLLATAGTIEGIGQCIAQFYGGENKTLRETRPNEWEVISPGTLRTIEGVKVVRKKGRYRFEMIG